MGHAVRRETGYYPARGMWLRRLIVRCTRRPIFFCGKKDWGEKAAKREDPLGIPQARVTFVQPALLYARQAAAARGGSTKGYSFG